MITRRFARIGVPATALLAAALGAGCGKTVELGGLGCGPDDLLHWEFRQPDPREKRAVDLLFIVDTSTSLTPERTRVAATLPAFISRLAPGTDYRAAVMLGHGPASSRHGKLFSANGIGPVMDSSRQTAAKIQSDLGDLLSRSPDDADEGNGEMLFSSLLRSLDSDRFAEIRAQGFYRPGAALAAIFVSDENDVCFPPELNGYSAFPDFVASTGGIESVAYRKHCKRETPAGGYPELVYSRLKQAKEAMPVSVATITHVDPARVPRKGEDSIGHGFLELIARSPNGVAIDIGEASYSDGLSRLGTVVSTELDLMTEFRLDGADRARPETVFVTVDGDPVDSSFDTGSRSVEIGISDAGRSGSMVQVTACRR